MLKNLRNLSLLFLLISSGAMSQGFPRNITLNGIVINEFMAANVSTIPDQDGEYDDWVEIYNNSSAAINMTGYNISDKPDNLDKWTFPDTTIQAGGYIVVWCDEDSSQAGLHANFKLSATLGEEILLSDPSLDIIDDVVFGPQKADTTTGRFPNGAGPFIEMRPTFGAENVNGFPTGIGIRTDLPGCTSHRISPTRSRELRPSLSFCLKAAMCRWRSVTSAADPWQCFSKER